MGKYEELSKKVSSKKGRNKDFSEEYPHMYETK